VAAINLFARSSTDGAWRMVVHHGSPVSRSVQPSDD
jgi:hypothetical protein